MGVEYKARVFKNGRSRAIRIPVGIDLPGEEMVFRQEGRSVIVEPATRSMTLEEWIRTAEPLAPEDSMPKIERLPAEPVEDDGHPLPA